MHPSRLDTAASLVLDQDNTHFDALRLRYFLFLFFSSSSSSDPLRRKIDWHIMPFMCSTSPPSQPVPSLTRSISSHVSVRPPSPSIPPSLTLQQNHLYGQDYPRRGSSPRHRVRSLSLLVSLIQSRPHRNSAHLNATQFNWLGTIFYFSYLIFQYPQNLALQRFPVGKWMRYYSSYQTPPS